ncbi:flagellar export chaperone FliS [Siccibacter turicensis]|uniref:flagellar export chaperone FliS n=1 Tax=Siccibacter turicensis TaxID=357233 RepID=UPI00101F34C5|nr:flagellar export chaperone FliS [Siccibacter turicensis]
MYGSNTEGYGLYKEMDLASRTAAASPLDLVLVLYNGLMDELQRAKSHIDNRRYERKAQSINKCIDILNALTSSLEFDTGGDLVLNLARLYDHCVYRLYEASGQMEKVKIDEVIAIISNLKEGWEGLSRKLG